MFSSSQTSHSVQAPIGEHVQITVRSQPELNERPWVVSGYTDNGRVLVTSLQEPSSSLSSCPIRTISVSQENVSSCPIRTISVSQENVHPCAVVPFGVAGNPDVEAQTCYQQIVGRECDSLRLDEWIKLPGLGANAVMLKHKTELTDRLRLVMYPRLQGYDLFFKSTWAGEKIQLLDCDVLKMCPAGQVWPWCAYCQKFLSPVDVHRASKMHSKCIENLEQQPDSATVMSQCIYRIAPNVINNLHGI